jgi:hypothetical protein
MPTLALLSGSPAALTLDDLRASLDRAFPGEFLPQRDDRSFVVEGETPGEPYFIKSLVGGAEGMFLLHHQVGSAEDWSDMDFDDTDDPVFRRLVRADHSMMSIHMIKAMAGEDAAYSFMLRALAEIAPPEPGFLLYPSRGCVPFDDKVRRMAAAGRDPFQDTEYQA